MEKKATAKKKSVLKRLLYIVYLLVAVFILLELVLRIFDPFHLRLKGDKIVLPVNQQLQIDNSINPRLEPHITNTRNSMGFRGPEWPSSPDSTLTMITVGGSTTACHFLNDTKTWPWLLGKKLEDSFNHVWMNNAGLDGHSTFGHEILLNDYLVKLHPKVILFLTGINEIENDEPSFHDKMNTRGAYTDFRHYIFENSEVLNLFLNLSRGWKAQRMNNTTNALMPFNDLPTLRLSDSVINETLLLQDPFLEAYSKRLSGIIDTCNSHGILPVMLTQPFLFGKGVDPSTGINLEERELHGHRNGKLEWMVLEKYNDVMRNLCKEKDVPCIDLAALMPKNSKYYYDKAHFSNEGADYLSSLLSEQLQPILQSHFPSYKK